MKKFNENPTVRVAIKRNVMKHYKVDGESVVFMSDGTEFQIELFNPLSETIMCKISLNGESSSEGLVLYPGQRVFLERHIDSDNKFLFKTYEVDNEHKHLTKFNGIIEVSFYTKSYTISSVTCLNPINWISYPHITYNTGGYVNDGITGYCNSSPYNGTVTHNSGQAFTSTSASLNIETGVVTKGEKSEQNLINTYDSFSYFSFHTEKIKILPDSQKVKTTDDFKYKKYCSNCGKKVNQKDKYCSCCGNKL